MLNKKPYVIMEFKKLEYETEKAYLFITTEREEQWLPKKICNIVGKTNHGTIKVLVAPFKYEELTGNEIQTLDTDLGWVLPPEKEPDIKICECEQYKLLPEQMKACKFILCNKICALFAETRTGKTIISLTAIKSRQNAGLIDKVIVICPVRIIKQWERYASEFEINNIIVIGTEQLSNEHTRHKKYSEILNNIDERTQIIIDESHMFKNVNTVRAELISDLISDADCYKMIMTGTPIGKHMGDLFVQFKMLDESILNYDSYEEFEKAHLLYGGSTGKKVVAYINIEDFTYSLQPYVYKLTRAMVKKDRPTTKQIVKFRMQADEYDEYYNVLRGMSGSLKWSNSLLAEMVKLQVVACKSKNRIKAVKDVIKERPIIFYKFDVEADDLHSAFGYPILNGKTSQSDFLKCVSDYNEFKNDGLIVNQSLATGFDLGTAEQIIFYSSLFDMIQKTQATDRAMNMWSEQELEIIEIVAEDTIDEQICKVLERKGNIKEAFYKELERLKDENKGS